MPPPEGPALARFRSVLDRNRDRLALSLASLWAALPGYDASDVDLYIARALPLVAGAKASTVAVSSAFYGTLLDLPATAVAPEVVPSVPALRDPFTAYWHALTMERPWEEAVQVGASTAQKVGTDYITSTSRLTGDHVAAAHDLRVRWRRVAEPRACDWCRQRDGGIYPTSADADYGHSGCNCDAVPEPT